MNYLSNKKMILGVILCVLGQVFIQLATVPVVLFGSSGTFGKPLAASDWGRRWRRNCYFGEWF
ncbi:MAG: hypothetical protein K2P76_06670 [Lachnospiraceae bacterium]|nr:hypothetical protein [Lachnospiraceae bacterium]